MAKWTDSLLTTAPQPAVIPVSVETPVPITPTVAPAPTVAQQPDFETEVAFSTSGATKAERYVVLETLRERNQTASPELIFWWVDKLRNRERL